MRILVTGACGMLGREVCAAAATGHQVIPTDILDECGALDITNADQMMSSIGEHKPDMVIHCAAMTDVDGCTRDPENAYRINAFGTWSLACACAKTGCSLAYVSTDFVFDGTKTEPYTEFDMPNPLSAYGASKLAGENAVKETIRNFYIVRTSWLYAPHSKNFPLSILKASETRRELKVVADQIGSPTYARDLAEFLVSLAGSPLYGTYHFSNAGCCSWYDFAVRILASAGKTDVDVMPISSDEWPTPTRRPAQSALRRMRLELLGRDKVRRWEDTVEEFAHEWTTARQ